MSKIEWTDGTSNPIHLIKNDGSHGGHWCRKTSTGCAGCYSEAQNQSDFFKFASHLSYTGNPPENLILDESILKSWLKLKKSQKIFVCSMTDLFGEWVPDAWILKIFTYMRRCPNITFQILTKRPGRMLDFISRLCWRTSKDGDSLQGFIAYLGLSDRKPLQNVWLGTSIENQSALTKRARHLQEIHQRGWTTFYSVEPLLEEVNLYLRSCPVSWVIVGGESGKDARPCQPDWIQSVIEQCQQVQTPVYVKQFGSNKQSRPNCLKGKGGDFDKFPKSFQLREFPVVR
ncbi:phage protein Gp37/Gp68 [Cylindrospermum sp. NIES-4074]|nr:phage protein Gp37/Gp68 [Cylindrospermum sp. NIES-4074]